MAADAVLVARFAREFAVPLLLGRRAVVGSPLGRGARLALQAAPRVEHALEEACEQQVQEAAHLFDITPAPFDEDAGTLLFAVHELFACTDPQASSFYARAHLFCRAASAAVGELPRTFDARRLVTRHMLVARAFAATRTDIHLKWWTGSANFYGTEAPRRLTAWRDVRRVQEQRLTQPMWKLALGAGDEELRTARVALLNALLDASPLTRMFLLGDPAQKALGFSLMLPYRVQGRRASPIDVLDDRRLARAVVDQLIDRRVAVAGAPLVVALLQALREGCPPSVQRRTVELCVHLALQLALIEAEHPGAAESTPLRQLLDVDTQAMDDGHLVFWSVIGAAFALDGRLLRLPSPATLPERAAALWARMQTRLGTPRLAARSQPLAREIARRLPKGDVLGVAENGA
jgi:hypothetical protein